MGTADGPCRCKVWSTNALLRVCREQQEEKVQH